MYKNFRTSQEFINEYEDLCEKQCITSLKYGGSQELNMYTIDYAENEFILPEVNDRIIGVHWTDLPYRGIRLPEDMYMFGMSYDNTFEGARIIGHSRDNKLSFGSQYTSVNGIFHNAEFYILEGELTIFDSILNINSMFYCSNGLQHVIFKNCELAGITNVFLDSDVRHVTFDNCSEMYVRGDYKGLARMIFASHTTKLTLKNCKADFVNTIIGMFDDVDGFENLEIEILD
jgi:hypothetical protein